MGSSGLARGVKDMKARCRRLRNGSSVSSSTTIEPTWNWRSPSVTGRVTWCGPDRNASGRHLARTRQPSHHILLRGRKVLTTSLNATQPETDAPESIQRELRLKRALRQRNSPHDRVYTGAVCLVPTPPSNLQSVARARIESHPCQC